MYISRAVGNLEGFRAAGGHTRVWERSRWDTLRIRQGDFGKSLRGALGARGLAASGAASNTDGATALNAAQSKVNRGAPFRSMGRGRWGVLKL